MVPRKRSDHTRRTKSVLQPRKRSSDIRKLQGRVALVTGASRGAGRAIAGVLGEQGATVYVTGRSVCGKPTTDNLPGTIEETAEEVSRRGAKALQSGVIMQMKPKYRLRCRRFRTSKAGSTSLSIMRGAATKANVCCPSIFGILPLSFGIPCLSVA